MPAPRTIWSLTHTRAGDLAQLRHLLHVLSQNEATSHWNIVEKKIVFGALSGLAPATALASLRRQASGLADGPWPDAVLATEKIATWVAADIKRRSGGATKLIVLGRMAGDDKSCDLVLATPQFTERSARCVMLPVPLAPAPQPTPEQRDALLHALAGSPRPWSLFAIGGAVPPDLLDEQAARNIARNVRLEAALQKGTALVFTSPRTDEAVEAALEAQLAAPLNAESAVRFFGWRNRTGPNLFAAAMAEAERIVVTSDSISMVAEAIDSGKPVSLYRLPQQDSLSLRIGRSIARDGAAARLAGPLLRCGIVETPPDRARFFHTLIDAGWLAEFPAFPQPAGDRPLARAERLAADAVAGLLA